jgi:hypothetical protein
MVICTFATRLPRRVTVAEATKAAAFAGSR